MKIFEKKIKESKKTGVRGETCVFFHDSLFKDFLFQFYINTNLESYKKHFL